MRKILSLVILTFFAINAVAQNNVIIQQSSNSSSYSENSNANAYYINGICSCDDIGGVSIEEEMGYKSGGFRGRVAFNATNYNSVAVTLLVECTYYCNQYQGEDVKIVTLVLKPNETKTLPVPAHCSQCNLRTIVRPIARY